MSGPPVFIIGSERSGTTLVRLMLDSHPQLAVPPESHFIPGFYAQRHSIIDRHGHVMVEAYLELLKRQRRFQQWGLPIEAVRAWLERRAPVDLAGALQSTFEAYAERDGKERWGDKTPKYAFHIPLLARLFPSAQFIHLIRDGRDVSASLRDRSMAERSPFWRASRWVAWVSSARQAGRHLPLHRYLEFRYESLVDDPGGSLRQICDFIGLPFDPGMLEYGRRVERALPREWRAHWARGTRLTGPVRRLRDWRTELGPHEVAVFEAIAGRTLREFGYPDSGTRVPFFLRLWGAFYFSGARMWRSRGFGRQHRLVRSRLRRALSRTPHSSESA